MLWCLIYEPNGVIHELYLKKDAKGQDCHAKVCYSSFKGGQGKPNKEIAFTTNRLYNMNSPVKLRHLRETMFSLDL